MHEEGTHRAALRTACQEEEPAAELTAEERTELEQLPAVPTHVPPRAAAEAKAQSAQGQAMEQAAAAEEPVAA